MKLNCRVVFVLTLLSVEVAKASILDVTRNADSGPGTLRDALVSAADGDTINVTELRGTILLTTGELLVDKNIAIVGPGPGNLTVDGNHSSPVFHIGPGVDTSLTGLTIANGAGCVINNDHATLTVSKCAVIGNHETAGGSGIVNDGENGSATLNMTNSLVTGNSCIITGLGSDGGGISNHGQNGNATMTLVNSVVSDNTGYLGGGIFNYGQSGSATATLVRSVVRGNHASAGGGIYNAGWSGQASLTLEDSTITKNEAESSGGGISNDGDSGMALLAVTNCAITDNRCLFYDEGDVIEGGGGICNFLDGGSATVILVNSTISGNTGAPGGGICNHVWLNSVQGDDSLQILNCTLSDNSAPTIYDVNNTANPASSESFEIGSTILKASASGSNFFVGYASVSDTMISLGYNLSSDDGGGVLTSATDLINTEPRLGPLRDNGGPTFTHALLSGSPAVDQGKNFSGSPFDQRGLGFARTFDNPFIPNAAGGDGTDIGAFEVQTARPGPGRPVCVDGGQLK